ncbi:hypothetical protein HZA97_03850 [Candidatus Woesearchaeota archaeon]|nr:hypothetical protein [Candidatus Woesearchaeota archaeon]
MSKPPKTVVVELTETNIRQNLLKIIKDMESIRLESIANLGSTDEQKTDYLRLTGELSGCLKETIKEDNLEEHLSVITGLVEQENLLKHYDPLQNVFWEEQKSEIQTALTELSAVVLKEEFCGISQAYHLFQAIKLLNAKNEEREEIYETILPVNSLLKKSTLKNPKVSMFLIKELFKAKTNEDGTKINAENPEKKENTNFVETMFYLGALCVDLPKEAYTEVTRIMFPKTTLAKENDVEIARVIFYEGEAPQLQKGLTDKIHQIAKLDLEKAEEDLVKKIENFYSYGKEFQKAIQERTGMKEGENKKKEVKKEEFIFDYNPADGGVKKTRKEWSDYWDTRNDKHIMASMGNYYKAFKKIKNDYEKGGDKKIEAIKLLDQLGKEIRYTDSGKNWLSSSTVLKYSPVITNVTITHNCSNKTRELSKYVEFQQYRSVNLEDVNVAHPTLTKIYLQTLFDTDDDFETILQTLKFISPSQKVILFTAQKSNNETEKVAGFYIMNDQSNALAIDCDNGPGNDTTIPSFCHGVYKK